MVTVVYGGLTKEQKESRIANQVAAWSPNERDKSHVMLITRGKDTLDMQMLKKERRAKAIADHKKEVEKEVELIDARIIVFGIEFPKGKPVQIDDGHPILEKRYNPVSKLKDMPSKLDNLVACGQLKLVDPKVEKKVEK